MKLYIYISSLFFTLVACTKISTTSVAYLGGEIVNKNTDYVVLFDTEDVNVSDTLKLNRNNRFFHKLENFKPGLYTFKHGGEIQMILIEPGDSLMFRLNTLDFDESLVYTGKGSKKNNYLIDDFLQTEIDKKRIYKFCQLSPKQYQKHIDSIKIKKDEKLKNFKNKHNPSHLFDKIAQTNIDYGYFSNKEIYPFVHYGKNKKKTLKTIPNSFYKYRKHINYNDNIKHYFNYFTFLKSSSNNVALDIHLKHNDTSEFKWMDLCYNLDRIKVIDSLINNSTIKNKLLYHYCASFISKNQNFNDNDKVVKSFLSKSTDKTNNENIISFNKSLKQFKKGEKFPDIKVATSNNELVNIHSLSNKPNVIYFWSHLSKDYYKKSHNRVKDLIEKYPEIDFLSINIDDYNKERWIATLKEEKFNLKNEYIFENPKASKHKLAIYPLTKVILLDGENNIVNGHTNLFANNFEQELLTLLNQQTSN